jgi:hypothetical protein
VESPSRTRLIALAVLLALSIPLIVIAVAGSGSGDEEAGGLRVEPTRGTPELVIYVEDVDANRPETAGGRRSVRIECLNEDGAVVFSTSERWPFTDTDGGRFEPHVHTFVPPDALPTVASCRLKGTDPPLEGPKV